MIEDKISDLKYNFMIALNPNYKNVTIFYRTESKPNWTSIEMFKYEIYFSIGIPFDKNTNNFDYYYIAETQSGEKCNFGTKEKPNNEMVLNKLPMVPLMPIFLAEPNPTKEYIQQNDAYSGYWMKFEGNLTSKHNIIPKLRAFLCKFPNSLDAWTKLGTLEYHYHYLDDALTSLQIANSLAEKYSLDRVQFFSLRMLRTLGILYRSLCLLCEKDENYKDGVIYAAKLSKIEPYSSYSWYNLGDFRKKLKFQDGALDAYRHAVSVAPENLDALYYLANYLLDCNLIQESQNYFQQIKKILNENPNINRQTGVWKTGQIVTGVLTGLAKIEAIKKNFKKARKYFSKAFNTDPNNPFNNGEWGIFEFNQGNLWGASDLIKKSISIQETKPQLYLTLGKIYFRLFKKNKRDSNQAYKYLMKGLMKGIIHPTAELLQELDPKTLQITALFPPENLSLESISHNSIEWRILSEIYFKMNDFEKAHKCCQIGLKSDPENFELLNFAAFVSSKMFYLDEAENFNLKILTIQKNSSKAHSLSKMQKAGVFHNLGSVMLKKGNILAAITYFKKSCAESSDRVEFKLSLARAYYLQNEFDKARTEFQAIINQIPFQMQQNVNYFMHNIDIAQRELQVQA